MRLFAILDHAARAPVVLVCGPAGSGKSLLVASWLVERDFACTAWLSVGAGPARSGRQFWSALVQALLATGSGDDLDDLVRSPFSAPVETVAHIASWLNRQDHDTYLVVEDLHLITDGEVHEQLVELVAAAPDRLHLIAVARHDPPWPLHRMRLDGLLESVRGESLAFTEDEAMSLFQLMDVPLDPAAVGPLVATTEGWAAGLRLAALGAADAPDPAAYIACISGRDAYIADFLLKEVYESMPAARRSFLAVIGVVDEVSGALAEALGGGPDSTEQLAELARQNLFIYQLGDRLGWYRIHPLLLDVVRSRATDNDPARRRLLHARAARWFRSQGYVWSALRHAVLAQDWDFAENLADTHVVSWTVCRPPDELKAELSSVPREAILTHPGLAVALAAALAMLGEPQEVPDLIDAVRSQLPDVTGRRRRRYEFLLDLISIGNRRWSGYLDSVIEGYRRLSMEPAVLGSLGLSDWLAVRTLLMSNLGTSELWTGEVDAAFAHLSEAARVGDTHAPPLPALNAMAHLGVMHWIYGELNEAETLARRALDGFVAIGAPDAEQSRAAYLTLAGVAVDHDDLEDATRWLGFVEQAEEPHLHFVADLLRCRLEAARGQLFQAVVSVRDVQNRAANKPIPAILQLQAVNLEAELLVLAGRQDPEAGLPYEAEWSSGARVAPSPTKRGQVEHHLVGSARALGSNRRDAALERLELALRLAAPESMRQPFLARSDDLGPILRIRMALGTEHPDFVVDLLGRMSTAQPSSRPGPRTMFAPLTARETNILRYLATTMSAKEIAQTLYVSVNTVKTHQRSIHQKLGATDRRAAVAHGRSLGLI